MAFDNVTHWIS